MFKNKILLITGGTGSFGNAVMERFLNTEVKEVRIFSRDELKRVPSCEFFPMEVMKMNVWVLNS